MQTCRVWIGVLSLWTIIVCILSSKGKVSYGRFLDMRHRVKLRRLGLGREELKPKICYELVGCFADPPGRLPLKRPPEHPDIIQTRFFIYTRQNRKTPEALGYGYPQESIGNTSFSVAKPLKIIIHGFKGSGSDQGIVRGIDAILNLEDVNLLVLDWTRGAATTYGTAVANTELVGRQLALVLLDAINLGIDSRKIHAIGFSLGAHVAGCASELLKRRNVLLGRITGLDPASPLFRHHLLRDKSKKLDASDARFVDIIHTDGSEDFTDGFGLLKPLGHVDFFPNGGKEQPGCSDIKNSVVVSHLHEELLDRQIACSHLKAWQYFVESILTQTEACKFIGWPCSQGRNSYMNGACFPFESTEWSHEMGYAANRGPLGIYYLPTRNEEPYCGQPLRVSITILEGAPKIFGTLLFKLFHDNSTTTFKVNYALPKAFNDRIVFSNIAAVKFQSISNETATIKGMISFQNTFERQEGNSSGYPNADTLLIHKVSLVDRIGNRWEHYNIGNLINEEGIYIELRNKLYK